MKYFGSPDTAPVFEFAESILVPVGRACVDCGVHMGPFDVGFVLPFIGDPDGIGDVVYHRACLARCLGLTLPSPSEPGADGGGGSSSSSRS